MYNDAVKCFKKEIADITSWYPNTEEMFSIHKIFTEIDCKWIITTNYDLVIESILMGKGISIKPNDPYIMRRGKIPVVHFHGIKTDPEGMVVTDDDYVRILSMTEYRQIKLSLLMKESTVVIVGYAVNDINVVTALEWSKSIYSNDCAASDGKIVMLKYEEVPKQKPYMDKTNRIVIIETNDVLKEMETIGNNVKQIKNKRSNDKKHLSLIIKNMQNREYSTNMYMNVHGNRETLNTIVEKNMYDMMYEYMQLVNSSLEYAWKEITSGNEQMSAMHVHTIIDLLIMMDKNADMSFATISDNTRANTNRRENTTS